MHAAKAAGPTVDRSRSESRQAKAETARTVQPESPKSGAESSQLRRKASQESQDSSAAPVETAAASAAAAKGVPNRAQESRPNPEITEVKRAIQVFRRETARLTAGTSASGRRKSSQNPLNLWHGRVYEYLRNDSLDAVPHQVVQRGGDRNILRRNQFGFSVSGPAFIPKLYEGRGKTFFTFSYEGTRERVGRSFLNTLPTAPQRLGDFSDLVNKAGDPVTIYDPASTWLDTNFDPLENVSRSNLEYVREPFPNNQIPASRLDKVAAAMVPHIPLPNTNVGPFLRNNYWVNPPEENAPDGFLAKVDHNLWERHKITVDLAYSKGFRGSPRIFPTIANPGQPDRNFSDRSLRVTETFSVSPNAVYTARFRASSEEIRTAGLSTETGTNIPAALGLAGVTGGVFPSVEFKDLERLGSPRNSQFRNAWNNYRTDHGLTLRRGKHAWTFSGELTYYQLNTFMPESPSGSFNFNDEMTGLPGIVNTGSSFASFLLGRSYRAEATDLLQPSYLRRTSGEFSVRDEYEVSPNLTATLSLNLDVSTPRVEKFNRQSTVDLTEINPENGRPGALVFAEKDGRGRAFQPLRLRLEPRIGVAWSPTEARDTVVRLSASQYYSSPGLRSGPFATQGFSARRTVISPNPQLEPAVTLEEGVPPLEHPLPDLRPTAANDTDPDFIPQTSRQPRYRYAALDLERRLPVGLTARLGGRLYRAEDILVGGTTAGINAISLDALAYRDALNDESFRRSLRPYPQFQVFQTDGQFPLGRYKYHSGFVSLEKRASHGLTFDLSYTTIRQWDDYSGPGVQDYFNRDNEWAISRGLRPDRISLSYVYELPFGDGKPMLRSSSLLGHLLGNWSLSGFTRWYSGDPIALRPEFNNTGGVVRFLRVNPMPGVDPHVANPGPELWFNPAAFVDPDDFEVGLLSRTHPSLRNPGWNDHDLSVTKRVPISAERSLELMFQSFNFINHANWSDPDPVIGPPQARNANAGKIIGSNGGRVVQLGLRYNF